MRQDVLGNDKELIAALRAGLVSRLGRERFELWFGSNVRLELAGEAVVVSVSDQFVLERLRRQFGRDIQHAASAAQGCSATVTYRVDASSTEQQCDSASAATVTLVPAPTAKVVRALNVNPAPLKGVTAEVASDTAPRRRYASFEAFVVGVGNKLAYTAAQSVIERLGALSPLLVYGPTGSGKSHLLEAIWTASRTNGRRTRSLLLSAEQFTTYFLEALQGSGLPSFRRKVRDVDLLLIDDIHFFAGKRATMVEFQHTLDALQRQGRQLVVAADRSPAELTVLGPELTARLAGGLVCGTELADYETRRGIARRFAARDGAVLPESVLDLIALETNGDARQIAGSINRLRATSLALQEPITLDRARTALADIFAAAKRIVRLPDIERCVCEVFGLDPKTLRDASKTKAVSQPRMLAMWLARRYTRAAFSEIGEFFGRRSHTTVISAEQKVNRWVAAGEQLQLGSGSWPAEDAIRRLETKLRTG